MNNFKMTNKGTLKLNDNSGSSIGSSEIESIKNYYDNTTTSYKEKLIDYLFINKLTVYGTDKNTTDAAIGWLLPRVEGGCGLDNYFGGLDGGCDDGFGSANPNAGALLTESDPIWEADKPGIQSQIDSKANIDSPTFTGIPNAPTAYTGTDTTQIATTEFVNQEIAASVPTPINAILNQTSLQTGADFNIDGSGDLWGLLNGFTYNSAEMAYAFSNGCFIQTEIPDSIILSWELYIAMVIQEEVYNHCLQL